MERQPLAKILDLSGKIAIVTGAVGIGESIAYRLAEAGASVMIASRHGAEAEQAAAALRQRGWQAQSVEADVSQEAAVQNMVTATVAAFGSIDILVNNAGIYPRVPVLDMTLADFQQVIAVNLQGVFLCTKYVAAQMVKQGRGGKIINISSIDALHPSSVGLAHYDASKHGVWGFTKNAALEFAPHGITVNAIAPGGILTHTADAPSPDMAKIMEAFLAKIPMHRMGEPDEIGKVALLLASDVSSYMTGSQIVVDGGVLLS